ncbi:MAG: VOC family protein [Candidatus Izemoplasmataceae bacterium]
MNRLNIITLGVKDIKKSLAFYKGLGFKTSLDESSSIDIVFFDNEGTKLALYPLEALARDIHLADPPKKGDGFNGITIAYNVLEKNLVDETLALAEKLGGKIIKPADQVFWGGYSGYFEDIDGYIFEVAYSETFKFDEANMLVVE